METAIMDSLETEKIMGGNEPHKPIEYTAQMVRIGRIRPCPYQVREYFDPEETTARAQSMKKIGQQTPVTVEEVSGDPDHDYELIDGESRWRSAKEAGIEILSVLVRSEPFASKSEKHLAGLVANRNRTANTAMELSNGLRFQMEREGMTQAKLAAQIGENQKWVSKYLSLQNLHPDIKALLHPKASKKERITPTAAISLARVTPDQQLTILKASRGGRGRPTKMRIDIEVEKIVGKMSTRKRKPSERRRVAANTLQALESDLLRLQKLAVSSEDLKKPNGRKGSLIPKHLIESVEFELKRLRAPKTAVVRLGPTPVLEGKPSKEVKEERRAAWKEYWLSRSKPGDEVRALLEIAFPFWKEPEVVVETCPNPWKK